MLELDDLRLNVERALRSRPANQWSQVMISPRVAYPSPALDSVKLEVHNNLRRTSAGGNKENVISFTCDPNSTVYQVLVQILCNMFSGEDLQLQKYGLRVRVYGTLICGKGSLS